VSRWRWVFELVVIYGAAFCAARYVFTLCAPLVGYAALPVAALSWLVVCFAMSVILKGHEGLY
jgi:hypothetical protein